MDEISIRHYIWQPFKFEHLTNTELTNLIKKEIDTIMTGDIQDGDECHYGLYDLLYGLVWTEKITVDMVKLVFDENQSNTYNVEKLFVHSCSHQDDDFSIGMYLIEEHNVDIRKCCEEALFTALCCKNYNIAEKFVNFMISNNYENVEECVTNTFKSLLEDNKKLIKFYKMIQPFKDVHNIGDLLVSSLDKCIVKN